MVAISRAWYNGSYTMPAQPIKSPEMHYTMILFLIKIIHFIHWLRWITLSSLWTQLGPGAHFSPKERFQARETFPICGSFSYKLVFNFLAFGITENEISGNEHCARKLIVFWDTYVYGRLGKCTSRGKHRETVTTKLTISSKTWSAALHSAIVWILFHRCLFFSPEIQRKKVLLSGGDKLMLWPEFFLIHVVRFQRFVPESYTYHPLNCFIDLKKLVKLQAKYILELLKLWMWNKNFKITAMLFSFASLSNGDSRIGKEAFLKRSNSQKRSAYSELDLLASRAQRARSAIVHLA